ncbi:MULTISPECIES: isoprenyl transferase [unclassified Corynebacterium]|uniref:isoprenyl transferase n=2 Tax=Corynebacterium TaxID=1716 RepID=UPI002648C946|nr:isoprenyl transferase [Corynebacterium sp.]MDN5581958.1 isoprenyl transferase [Corynebacterium sp.]MDN5719709.1 isoprenyl transferase [Corynebacterium sp.]MDN6323919.1 isoprenyl transferase [Corynebacterium sp.]MDN6510121.1 isoprenyl transferase [Corynebacterium sp.]
MILYSLYERRLQRELKGRRRPKHVAIMCDGNRRWARENGFTDVSHGHRVGAKKIVEVVDWCDEQDIESVTVYLLSTENLRRSAEELGLLMRIIGDVSDELAAAKGRFRLHVMGRLDLIPDELRERMRHAEARTADHTGVHVNIAVGYGGRQEIVDGVQKLVDELAGKGIAPEEMSAHITDGAIGDHLYTSGQPDPDLVIRTSGEQRLSGFLLWQSAYSEIWFTDTYWPAFRRLDFLRALRDFSVRERRYGK